VLREERSFPLSLVKKKGKIRSRRSQKYLKIGDARSERSVILSAASRNIVSSRVTLSQRSGASRGPNLRCRFRGRIDRMAAARFKCWKSLVFRGLACARKGVPPGETVHYRAETGNKLPLNVEFNIVLSPLSPAGVAGYNTTETPRGAPARLRCTRTMRKLRVYEAPHCEAASKRVKATTLRAI